MYSLSLSLLQAGKRTDSFRVSWSLVRAWVFRGSHTTEQLHGGCYVISNIRKLSNKFFVTTNMQGTNSLIFVLDYRSFFEELLFVCINCMLFLSHLSISIYNMVNMYTNYTSPQSLVDEIKILGHRTPLLWRILYMCYVGFGRKENKAPYQIWQKLSLKALNTSGWSEIE